ncbi:MAG: DM13 domain-containing protein [Spirosomataceae bacterium]
MYCKWLVMGLILGVSACQKTEELQPIVADERSDSVNKSIALFDSTGQSLVAQGDFVSNVHTTSGNIKLYEKAGRYTLVFNQFKTDPGPDLRIYLSEDQAASVAVEVSGKVNTGNYFIELPAEANPRSQKFVLIWCKRFSVLFGNALLR